MGRGLPGIWSPQRSAHDGNALPGLQDPGLVSESHLLWGV